MKVTALTGDMLMQACYAKTRLMAVITAFGFAAQATLQHVQTRFGLFQMLRIVNLFTRRKSEEMFDSNIRADARLFADGGFIGQRLPVLNRNRGEVLAACTATYGDGFNRAFKGAGKHGLQFPDFGNRIGVQAGGFRESTHEREQKPLQAARTVFTCTGKLRKGGDAP